MPGQWCRNRGFVVGPGLKLRGPPNWGAFWIRIFVYACDVKSGQLLSRPACPVDHPMVQALAAGQRLSSQADAVIGEGVGTLG
jgi:hypothetical protein